MFGMADVTSVKEKLYIYTILCSIYIKLKTCIDNLKIY